MNGTWLYRVCRVTVASANRGGQFYLKSVKMQSSLVWNDVNNTVIHENPPTKRIYYFNNFYLCNSYINNLF